MDDENGRSGNSRQAILNIIKVLGLLSQKQKEHSTSIESVGQIIFKHDLLIRSMLQSCSCCSEPATFRRTVIGGLYNHAWRCDRCLAIDVVNKDTIIDDYVEVDHVHLIREIVENIDVYRPLLAITLH